MDSSQSNPETVLRVISEEQGEFLFSEPSGSNLSRYCNGSSSRCELLVLKGSEVDAYTVFVPLDNGVWIIYLALGSSVEKLGNSTLTYRRSCKTVGVFEVYGSVVALCTDSSDDNLLRACELSVDINNSSSIPDLCGGDPDSLRAHLQLNGVPISNVIQIGNSFRDALLHFFHGKTLYSYSIRDTIAIQGTSLPLNCDFVSRIQLMNYNDTSAYLYCNDSTIYRFNLKGHAVAPQLIGNSTRQNYPCASGSFSITNNKIMYSLLSRNDLMLQLSSRVDRGFCIGTSTLLYEDGEPSLNLIIKKSNMLMHLAIESGRRSSFIVYNSYYVVLFRSGNIIVVGPDSGNSEIFQSSSAALPPMLSLISVIIMIDVTTNSTQAVSTDHEREHENLNLLAILVILVIIPSVLVGVLIIYCVIKKYRTTKSKIPQTSSGMQLQQEEYPPEAHTKEIALNTCIQLQNPEHQEEVTVIPKFSSEPTSHTMAMVPSHDLEHLPVASVLENIAKQQTEENQNDLNQKVNACR